MLLAIDIGNTNIVVGCFEGDNLVSTFRLMSEPRRTSDEYAVLLRTLLSSVTEKGGQFKNAIISSVVPSLTAKLDIVVSNNFSIPILHVTSEIETGLSLKILEPTSVGADRIVNAVAAKAIYGSPVVVIDLGTATSFDYVDKDNNYCGGIIAPGLEISLDALVQKTAKLPRIDLKWPETVIGNSTITAMQSGIVLGYACMIEGLITRISKELGAKPHIVATGGQSKLLAENIELIDSIDRGLTLKGLRLIADKNFLN